MRIAYCVLRKEPLHHASRIMHRASRSHVSRMSFTHVLAVLFDLDGTLVHTRIDFPGMKRAVLDLVAAAGLDPEEYRSLDSLAVLDAAAARLRDAAAFRERAEEALVRIELAACEDAREAEGAAETLRW